MKLRSANRRTLALLAVLVPMMALFVFVVLRAGPLAPVSVTVTMVENGSISPAVFGIGIIEARYVYRIGPTVAGRVMSVNVQVGEKVHAGQVLGEMDPVDFDERLAALEAASSRAEAAAAAADARVGEAAARQVFAAAQARRYEELFVARSVSSEEVESRRQESKVADASLAAARASLEAARQELAVVSADRAALLRQRANLRLIAPVDGLVTLRDAEPGTTVLAGQPVLEVIDPQSLWVNLRVDQLRASGLRAGLAAKIVLRSRGGEPLAGRVMRVEPRADAVTEEILAKVVFEETPHSLPSVGELAEVTVELDAQPDTPVVPNASLQRRNGHLGVWVIEDDALRFAPVRTGSNDLEGRVQILDGLKAGDRTVVYSQRALNSLSRVKILERLPGTSS